MPLTREQFDDLVRGVEKRFHQRTPALRWHLVGWVIVGYVGLLVGPILLGLLALVFFITALHVGPDGRIPVTVLGSSSWSQGFRWLCADSSSDCRLRKGRN